MCVYCGQGRAYIKWLLTWKDWEKRFQGGVLLKYSELIGFFILYKLKWLEVHELIILSLILKYLFWKVHGQPKSILLNMKGMESCAGPFLLWCTELFSLVPEVSMIVT